MAIEDNVTERAGVKFIDVTPEFDQLLKVVAKIARKVLGKADHRLRMMSAVLVGVSGVLADLPLS